MTDTIIYGCANCDNAVLAGHTGPDECPACGHHGFYTGGKIW